MDESIVKRIHIVGRKNSGKTTLIVDLVRAFNHRGYRVGTIKHTHHEHELDTPGKDSFKHRESGSSAVGILSAGMNAIFWPQDPKFQDSEKYSGFDAMMSQCDIVLVEGDSQTDATKIEVYRAENSESPIAMKDSAICAVVTDDSLDLSVNLWRRSELETIVNNIEQLMALK